MDLHLKNIVCFSILLNFIFFIEVIYYIFLIVIFNFLNLKASKKLFIHSFTMLSENMKFIFNEF